MPHSLAVVCVHLVFATKNRHPWLSDRSLRQALHGYLAGSCVELGCPSFAVGGVSEHVHLACRLSRTRTIASLAQELKQESSKWVKDQDPSLRSFYWQTGYGAFSVSPGHLRQLESYIANQEAHHQHESFEAEMSRLLVKYGLEKEHWEGFSIES